MSVQFRKTFFFILFFFSFAQSDAQGFLRTEGKKVVNEKGENVLLRGMGLGGWMLQEGYMLKVPGHGQQYRIRERIDSLVGPERTQEFYDAWLANHTRKIDVDSMKSWGFNSIRLPMHFNLYTISPEDEPVKGENTWLTKGFILTDSLLAWCKANKIYLILDLHAAPGGQGNDLNISDRNPGKASFWESEANQQKTVALWGKLAQRYANEPWVGGYDILNEPNWGFTNPVTDKNGIREQNNEHIKKWSMDVTKAIRAVDKNHMIIIEGNGWGNNYNGILPAWDNNMVLSFHKYWNYNDQASLQHFLHLRDTFNIPLWVGETGENSNVWYTEATRLLEQNNIGWAIWPLKKIGSNNPLEIVSNTNYDAILNYWGGKGKKPAENDAYNGLMQLAANTKLETSNYQKDVIDAYFRQPHTAETKPFNPQATITNNYILKAVDYDLGRNGTAYFDNDTANYYVSAPGNVRSIGNRGRVYRNDGVDIRKVSSGPGYYVSDIEDGEWLQYTVNVGQQGNYALKLMIASGSDTGNIAVSSSNTALSKEIAIPDTRGLQNWQEVEVKNMVMNKGINKLKIVAKKGGFNLQQIQFTKQ